jgi:Phage minor capsid protein 2
MARLEDEVGAELIRILEAADRETQRLLRQALERGALASAAYRARIRGLIALELEKARAELADQVAHVVGMSYGYGVASADRDVTGRIAAAELEAFGNVHADAAKVIAANLRGALDDALVYIGRSVDDLFRAAGLEASASLLTTGGTRREASALLVRTLAKKGATAFVDAAGREWQLSTYSRMVVRTTSREAVSVATLNRLSERPGVELVQVSKHPGGTDCGICGEWEGRVYRMSYDAPAWAQAFPVLDVVPPFHPNCRHVIGAGPLEAELETGLVIPHEPPSLTPPDERPTAPRLANHVAERPRIASSTASERFREATSLTERRLARADRDAEAMRERSKVDAVERAIVEGPGLRRELRARVGIGARIRAAASTVGGMLRRLFGRP